MRGAVLLLATVATVACQTSDVSRTLGARCDLNADCNGVCLAPSAGWPGGFCTTACDSDASCGDGARCIDENGGVCAFSCASDPDCAFLGAYSCVAVDHHNAGTKVMACRGQ